MNSILTKPINCMNCLIYHFEYTVVLNSAIFYMGDNWNCSVNYFYLTIDVKDYLNNGITCSINVIG